MKVIILAGGFGTRFSEYTEDIPKPMIPIAENPILWHLMKIYSSYGLNDFYIACGYKANYIKDFFLRYASLKDDFTVNFSTGKTESHKNNVNEDWRVTLVDTGLETMTGGRVKRMKEYIGEDKTFLLTYGDGLSNINIKDLVNYHKKHKKMVTVSAVRPTARFGELKLNENNVESFQEKPQLNQGWINGGFFVINSEFIDLIESDSTMLEREPLEKVASMGELMAYKHEGFWQCMDTKRDHQMLEKLWNENKAPWKKD
jgi:glucose-1-phosphate cytidylyltransferase